jgi:hypothetical protein
VIIEVTSASELQELGSRAISEVGNNGRRELELRLAPGRYEGVPIELGAAGSELGRLTLRATDPDRPPQLSDLSLRLRAEHVRLEQLVISATRRALPILAVEGRRVELRRCAIVGCRLESPPGGRLVELVASPGASAATATLQDCWFVDDHAPDHGTALIASEGHALVELDRVAFVANHAGVTLAPRAATVRLNRCLAAAAGADAVFLALTAPDARATLDRCVLAWPAAGRLVATTRDGAVARVSRSTLAGEPGPDAPIELSDAMFVAPPVDLEAVIRAARDAALQAARPDLRRLAAALGIVSASR